MRNFFAFKPNSRGAAALGAFAIGAIACTGQAVAAPQPLLFPFFPLPPLQYAQPPVQVAPSKDPPSEDAVRS